MWHSPKLFLSDLHSGNWHKVSDFLNCGFAGCLLLPLSPCVCFSLFLSLSMFHHQAYTNKRYMENLSTLWALRITLGELLSVHTQTWARNSRVWYTLERPQMEPLKASYKTPAPFFIHKIIIPRAKLQTGLSFARACFLINTTISWPSVKDVWQLVCVCVCVAPPTSFIHTTRCAQSGDDEIFNTNRPRAAYSDMNISYPK